MLSRFCEEFHCLPSQAYAEWQRLPVGFLETMLLYRNFVNVKQMYEHAGDDVDAVKSLPPSDMLDLVKEIEFDAVMEGIRQCREEHAQADQTPT